jgi:aminoglycoside phosphotransferase (APT) family kinase protein
VTSDNVADVADHLPFAAGREADVFALDDKRVLRRYRHGADTAGEASVMRYVRGFGFPVPEVHSAAGPDMEMERLHGPTMAQAVLAGSLPLAEAAATLAELLRRLHELPARSGTGTIVHLDLHPENVIMTAEGPMVIDWRNGGDGPGDLDTAFTALILAQVAIGSIEHPLGAGLGVGLDRFLELAPGDPIRLLDDAVALRRQHTTLSAEEIGMLGAAAARVRSGAR